MTTFERYFIADKKTHKEIKNPYYQFRDTHDTCQMILEEFALYSSNSRIINGHTPVKVKSGESPIKGEGMLFVIDGGLSKAYQKTTVGDSLEEQIENLTGLLNYQDQNDS